MFAFGLILKRNHLTALTSSSVHRELVKKSIPGRRNTQSCQIRKNLTKIAVKYYYLIFTTTTKSWDSHTADCRQKSDDIPHIGYFFLLCIT